MIQQTSRKNLFVLIALVLLFVNMISATCSENQININSASAEELDKLSGIGPVKAQAIIDSRVFDSVDDLIKTYGIGEVTLQKIKEQGLACVENEKVEEEETKEIVNEEGVNEEEVNDEAFLNEVVVGDVVDSKNILETITLEPKDIKSEENIEKQGKNNYTLYGFAIFCVLIVFLFIIKKNKFRKDEFD